MSRICEVCGKNLYEGMTDDYGSFYAHEGKCFETYMNQTYGIGQWMSLGNGEEDGLGGYYIHTADVVGGYAGTGIYYTEYYGEDEDEE